MRRFCRVLCAAAVATLVSAGHAGVSVYDGATEVVTIPSVKVGGATFVNVTLKNIGNFVFDLQGATESKPGGWGDAHYDAGTSLLKLPAVKVGDTTFLDVALLNVGNFRFTLQSATELPRATLDAVRAHMAAFDALWAAAVPATGALRLSMSDACYLHDGRTKPWLIADSDANRELYRQRDAYLVGRRSTNLQVLAMRSSRNPDGSQRTEVDVQYDIVYGDGSTNFGAVSTLISGSSAGSCATPQNEPAWRFLGNRQLIATELRARLIRDQRHAVATGAPLSPTVNYRRSVQFSISDPLANATYVIVTGPGPAGSVDGRAEPFSLKFISNRLQRSAPELQGKNGNFLNWLDDDNWRYCRISGGGVPVAPVADCVGQGATAFDLGVTTATPSAAADQSFADQGWRAGAVYRFDVYNDDGWRTVNGQAGKTPVASYFASLPNLPYSFQGGLGGVSDDRFPKLNFGNSSFAQVAANATSVTPNAMRVQWSPLPTTGDNRVWSLAQAWEFHQGPKTGNPGNAAFPAFRTFTPNYPGSAALIQPNWPVTARQPEQASKTYFEFTLLFSDRNDSQILSIVSFQ